MNCDIMYSNFQFVFQDWIVGKQFACNENWDSLRKNIIEYQDLP